MTKTILISFLVLLITSSFSQENWELQKEDEGIKVYTAEVEGSDLRAFKATAVMEGKLSSFVAVLKDIEAFPELFSSNNFAELIEQTDTFQLQYSRTKIPWPISDRDGVYANTFSQHYGFKTVTVTVESIDGIRPEEDGYVRMEKAKGFWMLNPVDHNAVEVTYQMHAEPGGNLPAWVINMFLVDSPLKDLKSMRERVKLPEYSNQKFDFLIEY